MTRTGTWCDGLEEYLYGDAVWPEWLQDGEESYSGVLLPTQEIDKSPLTANDRTYFMPENIVRAGAIPSWAVVEIMKALGENRRVGIHAPDKQAFMDLYELVGHPGLLTGDYKTARRSAN